VSNTTAGAAPVTPAATLPGLPARPVRADARRNHDLLLAAAGEAFAQHGPDAALDDIARRAGVGIGTLYRHFPTRESLMAAVVRGTLEDLRDRAAADAAAIDPWAAVEDWVRAYAAFAATKRGLIAGIVLLKEGDDQFAGLCDRMFAAVNTLVTRAQAAGVVRSGVSGRDLMHLAGAIAHSADNADDPDMPGRLLDLALAGLRLSPPAPIRPAGTTTPAPAAPAASTSTTASRQPASVPARRHRVRPQ
jgi:AcrR family transcriptional regulator